VSVDARDPGETAVARGSADDSVLAGQVPHDVEVEVVAQERERQAARAEVLLGRVVVPREGERRVRSRAEERGVDDVLDPRGRGGVDERQVLVATVRRLRGGDHEQHAHAVERTTRVVVRRVHGHRTGQRRRTRRVAHEQPLLDSALGQRAGDQSAQRSRGPGHRQGRSAHRLSSAPCAAPRETLPTGGRD